MYLNRMSKFTPTKLKNKIALVSEPNLPKYSKEVVRRKENNKIPTKKNKPLTISFL
jgi:hypothetical protein